MKCQRAIVSYRNGKPESYSLILEGSESSRQPKGEFEREMKFQEAYALFPAIRKNWNADGTAKA
jgi:hypothetical protein